MSVPEVILKTSADVSRLLEKAYPRAVVGDGSLIVACILHAEYKVKHVKAGLARKFCEVRVITESIQ